ncbi:unnamed protein product [Alopecurus aequalis]
MESSLSSYPASSNNKRAREAADLAGGEGPEAEAAKRLRPEDLLDMLDYVDTDAAAVGDLASVMRSLEEEISAGELLAPQPELGFLLEASDDELGLPPAAGSSSSSDDGAGASWDAEEPVFGAQIWGFDDELDGAGYGGYDGITSSPEAAASAASQRACRPHRGSTLDPVSAPSHTRAFDGLSPPSARAHGAGRN